MRAFRLLVEPTRLHVETEGAIPSLGPRAPGGPSPLGTGSGIGKSPAAHLARKARAEGRPTPERDRRAKVPTSEPTRPRFEASAGSPGLFSDHLDDPHGRRWPEENRRSPTQAFDPVHVFERNGRNRGIERPAPETAIHDEPIRVELPNSSEFGHGFRRIRIASRCRLHAGKKGQGHGELRSSEGADLLSRNDRNQGRKLGRIFLDGSRRDLHDLDPEHRRRPLRGRPATQSALGE
jgi:hypothetical protein